MLFCYSGELTLERTIMQRSQRSSYVLSIRIMKCPISYQNRVWNLNLWFCLSYGTYSVIIMSLDWYHGLNRWVTVRHPSSNRVLGPIFCLAFTFGVFITFQMAQWLWVLRRSISMIWKILEKFKEKNREMNQK